MDSFKNILAPDRIPCMTKVWKPLVPNQRERYLSPEELKNAVYNCPRIVELLNEVCMLLLTISSGGQICILFVCISVE